MVYVNSKKFACESCIKGHRSSSCHHNDRPLFEIKKKGRPVSQCEKCRELRQSKRVHSKCTCNDREEGAKGESSRTALGPKPKRFIPIVPALPNGLQDALTTSRTSASLADIRQRVDSLLNPCSCKSVWKCNCPSSDLRAHGQPGRDNRLDVLVRAAATMSENAPSESTDPSTPRKVSKRASSRASSPNSSNNGASRKRTKPGKASSPTPGPELPPIFLAALSPLSAGPSPRIPSFETMPPMSTITSLAGSGCTCGFRCACPGCLEHRGPEHASAERNDCADGCGTCVDHTADIALPTSAGSGPSSSTSNILDRFFARAAALPAPPTNRRMGVGVELDPMNVMVYPDAARSDSDRAVAFGLVTIPKLECCGGICGCPEGTCGCGKACDGCCADHHVDQGSNLMQTERRNTTPVEDSSGSAKLSIPAAPLRSCCAGKAALAA